MPQLLSRLPRRGHRHPWHLLRCSHCRKMILSSAAKCPHCAAWRQDARAFSVTFWAVMGVLLVAGAVWIGGALARLDRQRHEALQDEQLRQQRASGPVYQARGR